MARSRGIPEDALLLQRQEETIGLGDNLVKVAQSGTREPVYDEAQDHGDNG